VPYDYILVDSRTGMTELGGLCVGHLCDRLVVCTALNDQNINGTRVFLEEAGIELKVRSTENFEPWDEADPKPGEEETPETIGPKPTLIVATPVPYGEIGYKRERIKVLSKTFGPVSAKLSYHPQMALMESIFVRDYPEEYLTAEYQGLTDHMMGSVSDHYVQLSRQSLSAWSERNDPEEAVDAAIRAAGHNASAGISLLTQLGDRLQTEKEEEFRAAIKLHSALARLEGEIGCIGLAQWGTALSVQAKILEGKPSETLFTQAYEKYAKAVANKPDFYEAWCSWGDALLAQARILKGKAPETLFTEAYEKYAKAVAIKPDMHDAWNNWGTALSDQAKISEGKASETLFAQAYEKYAKAVAIKPDMHEAWNNWGNALSAQTQLMKGKQAEDFFRESRQKYDKALELHPGDVTALFNLACLEALCKRPEESVTFLRQISMSPSELRQKIMDDSDFDPIRQGAHFQDFLKTLSP